MACSFRVILRFAPICTPKQPKVFICPVLLIMIF